MNDLWQDNQGFFFYFGLVCTTNGLVPIWLSLSFSAFSSSMVVVRIREGRLGVQHYIYIVSCDTGSPDRAACGLPT